MVYSLSYRRPPQVPFGHSSVLSSDGYNNSSNSIVSGTSGLSVGIPDALAFDKIINGGTCPVSTSTFSLLLSSYSRVLSSIYHAMIISSKA
jgi:hypothetical protein